MNLLSRILRPAARNSPPVEGEYRPGPWHVMQGIIPASWPWNFWQLGYDPLPYGRSAIIQACISAYAQTIAMCPGAHWRTLPNGGRERVVNSALNRILRKPNSYQSISDFLLNAVSSLYEHGNAYALAFRNDRAEISELHLMQPRSSGVRIAQTGDVFYHLGGNEIVDRLFADNGVTDLLSTVPARDVMHIKLETPRHPLIGETPLTSVALDLATSNAMLRQSLAFFENQSRPSGTLNTQLELTKAQVEELRERWNQQSRGLNAGGTPILSHGLEWKPMSAPAKDSMLADILKITDQNIALAYRVPMQILGVANNVAASTETMMTYWIATGLGFAINHVELAFDQTFAIDRVEGQYTEFDTSMLLRSNFKERMEGLQKAVIGGIMSPNEARVAEGLPKVTAGDEPRVQQQVVPLSFALEPPAPPVPPAPPQKPDDSENDGDDERAYSLAIAESVRRIRGERARAA